MLFAQYMCCSPSMEVQIEETVSTIYQLITTKYVHLLYWPRHEKTCLRGFANNTGADQSAHPCSLISAFVIHFVESIISELATSEISCFYLVSVAEETCLKLALSETPKTGFLALRPNYGGLKDSIIINALGRYIGNMSSN